MYRLLAECARIECDAARYERLAQRANDVGNWEAVITRAEAHGLGPLLYHHLRGAQVKLPANVRRQLQGLYLRHRRANRTRTRVLGEILAALDEAGLEALVLKGAALSHLLYPEPGLRPMADLDLLVAKSEVEGARRVLAELGAHGSRQVDGALPEKHLDAAILQVEDLPVAVEIHYDLCEGFDPVSMTMEDLGTRRLPFSLGGSTAYTLSYEDMLWHLCHHMTIHGLGNPMRLIWVADIIGLAERFGREIDWDRVRRQYPTVLNALSLLHFVTPLSDALVDTAGLKITSQPGGIGESFRVGPYIGLAHWWRKGYLGVVRRALFPSELWLRLYYTLDAARPLFWHRWVRHPLEMLRLFGPRLVERTGQWVGAHLSIAER